ncbi:hypothetical protein DFH09DRAFT_1495356 [Mycena vulgaris]|nr:hypothetical protein DFH09DRAFT_1495356 [Mycena vulgaris]
MARHWQASQYRSATPELGPRSFVRGKSSDNAEYESTSSGSSRGRPTRRMTAYDLSLSPQVPSSPQEFSFSSRSSFRPFSEQQQTRSILATSRQSFDGPEPSSWSYQTSERRLSDLQIRYDTLQHAYTELIASVGSKLSGASSSTTSPLAPSQPNASTAPLVPLNREDYPDVPIWTDKDYLTEFNERKKAKDPVTMQEAKPQRGSKRLSEDDENVMYWFLTSEDGTMMPGSWVKTVRMSARAIWAYLHSQGAAPQTWSEATSLTRAYYAQEIEKEYPELRLCAFSSKVHRLATVGYPGWAKAYFLKNGPPPGVLVKTDPSTTESEAAAVVSGKREAPDVPADAPKPKKPKRKKSKTKTVTDAEVEAKTAAAMSPPSAPPTPQHNPPPHQPFTLLVEAAQTQAPLPLASVLATRSPKGGATSDVVFYLSASLDPHWQPFYSLALAREAQSPIRIKPNILHQTAYPVLPGHRTPLMSVQDCPLHRGSYVVTTHTATVHQENSPEIFCDIFG